MTISNFFTPSKNIYSMVKFGSKKVTQDNMDKSWTFIFRFTLYMEFTHYIFFNYRA